MAEKRNRIKIFLLCPIPEDQKPINEYINFKNSLTGKSTQTQLFETYLKLSSTKNSEISSTIKFKSDVVLLESFLIASEKIPSFSNKINSFNLFSIFKNYFPIWFFFWFVNFKNLEARFLESSLIYEEVSWYDTQQWEKPFFLIKNDRFLCFLILQPILKKNFLLFLVFFPVYTLFFSFFV
jgi:hypothetical protein